MATRRKARKPTLKRKPVAVSPLKRAMVERDEAIAFQAATADILSSISASAPDARPVFDAIVDNVLRLFSTRYAAVFLIKGDKLELAAVNLVREMRKAGDRFRASFPQPIDYSTFTGKALRSGKVRQLVPIVGNPEASPQAVSLAKTFGYDCIVVAPLVRDGQVIGAIGTAHPEAKRFDDRELALLKAFADQAVIAIENARLFNETKAALEQQTATSEVLKTISRSTFDLNAVLQVLIENATRLAGASRGFIFRFDGKVARLAFSYNAPPAYKKLIEGNPIPPGRGTLVARTLLEGRPVHIPDVLADPQFTWHEAQKLGGFRSMLGVPMARDGKLIGVIAMWSDVVKPFTDKQIELVATFADQAVIAIENVRLFNETKESLERQTATADILKVISSSPTDVQPVFDAIARNAAKLCESAYANVFRYDGERLHWVASQGGSQEVLGELRKSYPMPPNPGRVVGRAVLGGQALHVEDTLADPGYDKAFAKQLPHRRVLGVPLLRAGKPVGAITVAWAEPGPILARHEELLQTFADQAVIAIENVRLFNETKEALERQTATSDILRVISSTPTDAKPVFDAIVQATRRIFDGMGVGITLVRNDQLHLVAATNPEAQRNFPMPLDRQSTSGTVILERRVINIADVQTSDAPLRTRTNAGSFRAVAGAPLLREGEAIGALLVTRRTVGALTDRQLSLLQTFADQAVIAIENARLFNETKEALEQQIATSDILKVISSSTSDTKPVFEAIVRSAAKLFAPCNAAILMRDGASVDLRATDGPDVDREVRERLARMYPLPFNPETSMTAASMLERRVIACEDTEGGGVPATGRAIARASGFRSFTIVPLVREAEGIGTIVITSPNPGHKLDGKQLALLRTFADQAVIAIENARLFNETKEALERQTATSEILGVISGSPTDVQPVFDTIIANAVRLCGSLFGAVYRYEGDLIHLKAWTNFTPEALESMQRRYPQPAGDDSLVARSIRTASIVHVADIDADPSVPPGSRSTARALGYRSQLTVPLLRDGAPIGAIVVANRGAGGFPPEQIDLLKMFGDQAVIAIENVRLFNETKEALDQQKASADVLGAISGSIADTKPVFEKILASCERLFEGELVGITLADGDTVRLAAYHGPQGEQLKNVYPLPLTRESGTGWAILNAQIAHFPDIEAAGVPPGVVAGCRTLKVRAIVFAPMLFEGRGIGAIWVARAQAGAFTDKQIAQLRTFADQAVIAIQNARLVNETREALEQQTATAEVLKVISSSPTDVGPVFDAILRSAVSLCDAELAAVFPFDGELVHLGATHNWSPEALEYFSKVYPCRPSEHLLSGRTILSKAVVKIADSAADPNYDPTSVVTGHWRRMLGAPMLREGKPLGAFVVAWRDPGETPQRQVELLQTFADQAAIAVANVRLFREIQEKSAQLEVANKHKSDFLANMSHELRTPLNAIIGFSEVLSDRMFGEVNEKQGEYLKDIHDSGRHLLSLINDILDLSKIEAGRMDLELSSFDLPNAVSNAMTLIRERAQRHGIALGLDMDPRLGAFQADERKVKQILLNLLSNAVKFTPDGGRVDVSAKLDTDKVEITVKDTGIGIAPEDHAAVFEEFKQVGRDYTRKAEGTGLGLALTRRLVELHGGEIGLESALGKGSTFRVTLPLR